MVMAGLVPAIHEHGGLRISPSVAVTTSEA
jgi:hypothetical protein